MKKQGVVRSYKPLTHRAGTKAERAHVFVRKNRNAPRAEVIESMAKKFDLTPGTARNWFQSFRKHPVDFAPTRS